MGIENVQVIPTYTPQEFDSLTLEPDEKQHPLDSLEAIKVMRQLEDWWYQARFVQSDGRYEMALDEDFYDGLQWSDEDKQVLDERGQAPLVFNEIKRVCDWIAGTERRSRIDFNVVPRGSEDEKSARAKTKLLKYLSDVNRTPFHRSRAFEDASRIGLGWLEDGIRADPIDELIYSRYQSWRNMWYDHLGLEADTTDWRYVFRDKWLDLDVAESYFPDRADIIKAASKAHDLYGGTDDDEFFSSQLYYSTDRNGRPLGKRTYIEDASWTTRNRRARARLVECWFRRPVRGQYVVPEDSRYAHLGGRYDPEDPRQGKILDEGRASMYDGVRMQVWLAIFIEDHLLQLQPSPYRHDRFPFTPVWGYRRQRDGAPYGKIRNMRDPQEDLNKRRSKSQFLLSANQIVMDEGAVDNLEELRDEAADPNGIIRKRKGFELRLERNIALADAHVQLEQIDRNYINSAGGVTAENLGEETNATSGKAIQARQNEGGVVNTPLFDNLRLANQLQGELQLSLVEQFMDAEKVIRVLGDGGKAEFTEINKPTQDEEGNPTVENDITATKADFVIGEESYRESIRQAMHDQLMEVTSQIAQVAPEAAMQFLDLVVDMSDIPGKQALVERIRKMTGQVDPDAEDTPESQQAKQQAEQDAAMQKQVNEKAMLLELDSKEAEIARVRAEAQNIAAQAAASMQALQQAGNGDNDQQAQAYEQKIAEIQQAATQQISALQEQLQQSQIEARNQLEEINAKRFEAEKGYDAEVAKARLDSEAQVRIAEINAAKDGADDGKDLQEVLETIGQKLMEGVKEEQDKAIARVSELVEKVNQARVEPEEPMAVNVGPFNIDTAGGKKAVKMVQGEDGSYAPEQISQETPDTQTAVPKNAATRKDLNRILEKLEKLEKADKDRDEMKKKVFGQLEKMGKSQLVDELKR